MCLALSESTKSKEENPVVPLFCTHPVCICVLMALSLQKSQQSTIGSVNLDA